MLSENFWEVYRSRVPVNTDPTTPEDRRLRDEIITHYVPYAKSFTAGVVSKMPDHVVMSDYESEAMIGLMQAVKRFDPSKGVPFQAFMNIRMHSVIGDQRRKADWAPRSLRTAQRDMHKAQEKFLKENSREPSNEELAEAMDISLGELEALKFKIDISSHTHIEGNLEAQNKPSSFDPDEDELIKLSCAVVSKSLASLPLKQALVVVLHYYQDMKLFEVAELLRISETKVGDIHKEAVLKIWADLENVLKNE